MLIMIFFITLIFSELSTYRFLDLFQEIGFAIIYIFMGVFVLKPEFKVFINVFKLNQIKF